MSLGDAIMENFGLYKDRYFVWVGALVLIGYTMAFQIAAFLFLRWFNGEYPKAHRAVMSTFAKRRQARVHVAPMYCHMAYCCNPCPLVMLCKPTAYRYYVGQSTVYCMCSCESRWYASKVQCML